MDWKHTGGLIIFSNNNIGPYTKNKLIMLENWTDMSFIWPLQRGDRL